MEIQPPRLPVWGRYAILENGKEVFKGNFGPDRNSMTDEEWARFEKMRDGDHSQTEANQ